MLLTEPGEDSETAIKKILRHLGQVKAGRRSSDGELDLVAERARLAAAQTERVRFDLRRQRGEFVPRALIIETWTRQNVNVKNRLLGVPSKLGALFPHADRKILAAVGDLICEALVEITTMQFPADLKRKFDGWINEGEDESENQNVGAGIPSVQRRSGTAPPKAAKKNKAGGNGESRPVAKRDVGVANEQLPTLLQHLA